jgi:MATE family multidrug resistance protein
MSGIKTGFLYSVVVLLLFLCIPEMLVKVFRPSEPNIHFEQAMPIAKTMIRIASLYVLAEAIFVALVGALRGAGDTHWTMIASVTFHWTFVPVLYGMFYILDLSAVAGWLAIVIIFLLYCLVLFRRYFSGKWKNIRVVSEPEG